MKTYLRFIIVFIVAAAILFAVYLLKRATEPQSAVISRERARAYASRDEDRMKNDPVYAVKLQDTLALLDFRLAAAYNSENTPDKAIAVLRSLISDEESKNRGGIPRRSRSYMKEADYYDALKESFELKRDPDEVNKALDRRMQLMSKALESARTERSDEGKFVGTSPE